MDPCINHEDLAAVERCELCDRPLCALCLWYGIDGRRLCEDHAKDRQDRGEHVYSPAVYAEALQPSLVGQSQKKTEGADPTYRGNKQDLNALLAAVVAVTALFSCCGGVYCLPIISLALGLIAYTGAGKAIDPARTRRLAGIGIGSGVLMLAGALAFVGLYIVLIVVAVTSSPGP